MKIVEIRGDDPGREWSIPVRSGALVGRGRRKGLLVNLATDRHVSRSHARVWRESGRWWLQDLNSTNGTFLSDRNISGLGPVLVDPGVRIRVGRSVLVFATDDWHRLSFGQVSVEFGFPGVVGLSLALAGAPPITDIVVRNNGDCVTEELNLRVLVEEFGASAETEVPPLDPGQTFTLGSRRFKWNLKRVWSTPSTSHTAVTFVASGQETTLAQLEARVLTWNQWSPAPAHRCSIVPFVLPKHPLVTCLVNRARDHMANMGDNPGHLVALYQVLAECASAALPFSDQNQRSEILGPLRRGPKAFGVKDADEIGANVAIVLAGCLERLGLKPILAFVRYEDYLKTLLGTKAFDRSKNDTVNAPLANLIDPAGILCEDRRKMTYEQAREAAVRLAIRYGIEFSVDISVCRNRGVLPLPDKWWADFGEAGGDLDS